MAFAISAVLAPGARLIVRVVPNVMLVIMGLIPAQLRAIVLEFVRLALIARPVPARLLIALAENGAPLPV